MLLYGRNHHNIVKQLSSNLRKRGKKKVALTSILAPQGSGSPSLHKHKTKFSSCLTGMGVSNDMASVYEKCLAPHNVKSISKVVLRRSTFTNANLRFTFSCPLPTEEPGVLQRLPVVFFCYYSRMPSETLLCH